MEKKITITITDTDTFQVHSQNCSLIERVGMLTAALELAKQEIYNANTEPNKSK